MVRHFGFALFKIRLITVGGEDHRRSTAAKVLTLSTDSQRWEELISSMPTARLSPSVITTVTAIIAAGGRSSDGWFHPIATVELYSDNTSQWYIYIYTAEPLPAPHRYMDMSSVVIDDFCYLMEGDDCYRASLSFLIQRATSLQSKKKIPNIYPHPLYIQNYIFCH